MTFREHWKTMTAKEKKAMCDALEVTYPFISAVANGRIKPRKVVKIALGHYLEEQVRDLF